MIKVVASDHFDTIFSKIALQALSVIRLTTLNVHMCYQKKKPGFIVTVSQYLEQELFYSSILISDLLKNICANIHIASWFIKR